MLPALVEILRFGTNHSCIAPRFYSKWHGNPASVEDAARTEPKQETPSSEKANRKDGKKETTNLVAAASLAWPQPFPLGRLRASSCGTASRRDAFLLRRSPPPRAIVKCRHVRGLMCERAIFPANNTRRHLAPGCSTAPGQGTSFHRCQPC